MNIKNLAFAGLITTTVGLTLVTPTFAATKFENRVEGKFCEFRENKIDQRLKTYEKRRDNHIAKYNNAKDRITALADKYEQKGYDVSQIREDLKVWDDKVVKVHKDFDEFHRQLLETKSFACGESQGEFKESLNEAKAQFKVVAGDVKDVINFYKTTIKPDIEELKNQTPAPSPSPSA